MKKLAGYWRSSLYSIMQNKPYALFCILGTTLTFIFIVLIVQIGFMMNGKYPPQVYSDRIIPLENIFSDKEGNIVRGLTLPEINLFMESIGEYEAFSIRNTEMLTIFCNDNIHFTFGTFTNGDYWKMNQFTFLEGRAFTEEDCVNRKKYVVITRNMVKNYFNGEESVGKKIQFQGNEYEIIGVIEDFSIISSSAGGREVWIPYTFNKFMPSYGDTYMLEILFADKTDMGNAKQRIKYALESFYKNKNMEVEITNNSLLTLQEASRSNFGEEMLQYGIGLIIFLLLLIPALNIVTLNMAYVNNKAEEIAIRRSFGATRFGSFIQIMTENMILVFVGTMAGILLARPALIGIQKLFFDVPMLSNSSLIPKIDLVVIIAVIIPLMLIFFFSVRWNPILFNSKTYHYRCIERRQPMIKHLLKLIRKQRKSYWGIFFEQFLVMFILMLCMVTVFEAVKRYHAAGSMNTDHTVMYGYLIQKDKMNQENIEKVVRNMQVLTEELRKKPFVEAISATNNFVPYMRDSENYWGDTIKIDDKKFKTVIKGADEYGEIVFKPVMEAGTWLENKSLEDGSEPVVITRQFAEEAGWKEAVGKRFTFGNRTYTVVGVTSGLKQQEFDPSPVAMVVPLYIMGHGSGGEFTARVKNNEERNFFKELNKEFTRLIDPEMAELSISQLTTLKKINIFNTTLLIVLQALPTFFLLIFAFIGTFGLFWLHSRKHFREFALRIAVGSTKKQLFSFVIGESLIITCLAILPVIILSFFIYEYTFVQAMAVLSTVGIMILFSVLSAWFPAWKVSRLNPAEVLKYE